MSKLNSRSLISVFAILMSFMIFAESSQAALFDKYLPYRNDKEHYAWGGVSFWQGNFGLNAEYEKMLDEDFGAGGGAYFLTGKDYENTEVEAMQILYGFVKPHMPTKTWDFYLSPGAGIAISDGKNTFHVNLAYGTMLSVTRSVALGAEIRSFYALSNNDDFAGNFANVFSLKARIEL